MEPEEEKWIEKQVREAASTSEKNRDAEAIVNASLNKIDAAVSAIRDLVPKLGGGRFGADHNFAAEKALMQLASLQSKAQGAAAMMDRLSEESPDALIYSIVQNERRSTIHILDTVTMHRYTLCIGSPPSSCKEQLGTVATVGSSLYFSVRTGRQFFEAPVLGSTGIGEVVARAPMLRSQRLCAAAVLAQRFIYFLGGIEPSVGQVTTFCQCYSVGDDGWKQVPSLKEKEYACFATVVDERYLYCFTGTGPIIGLDMHPAFNFEKLDTLDSESTWELLRVEAAVGELITCKALMCMTQVSHDEFVVFLEYPPRIATLRIDLTKRRNVCSCRVLEQCERPLSSCVVRNGSLYFDSSSGAKRLRLASRAVEIVAHI